MNLNKVTVAGRLTKDIEIRYANNGTAVGTVSLAINRKYKGQDDQWKEEATFVEVDFFSKQAETLAENLRKGSPIYIEARLKLDSWEKDGRKFTKLKLVGESFQFVGPKEQGNDDAPRPARSTQAAPKAAAATGTPEDDSDVPF